MEKGEIATEQEGKMENLVPENQAIELAAQKLSIVAQSITVVDVEAMEKEIAAWFEPFIKKANETHKDLTSARAVELGKLSPAKTYLSSQVIRWEKEESKRRGAEQLRLMEIVRKQEEEARLAVAIEAEQTGSKEEAEVILNAEKP